MYDGLPLWPFTQHDMTIVSLFQCNIIIEIALSWCNHAETLNQGIFAGIIVVKSSSRMCQFASCPIQSSKPLPLPYFIKSNTKPSLSLAVVGLLASALRDVWELLRLRCYRIPWWHFLMWTEWRKLTSTESCLQLYPLSSPPLPKSNEQQYSSI